ncbi:hypothetical protein C0993_010341, partial [Termitomyces sp. T159_Od127]
VVKRLVFILRALHRDCQNQESKRGPQSEMMLSKSPCLEKTCSRKSLANSGVLSVMRQEMKVACLVRWKMMTRMVSKPSNSGSSTMWSI